MELKFLIIASSALVIILLWLIVGFRHFKFLRMNIFKQWELISERLRKRHDIIPNLIETVRIYTKNQEVLLQELILVRQKASREYNPGQNKIEIEHKLSDIINKIFDLGKIFTEMSTDTNFLELRKEINDVEQDIEHLSNQYNEMVRYYNRNRDSLFLFLLSRIFRFRYLNVFEVEV